MCFFLPVGKPPWKTSSCACAVLLPEPSQARRPALLSLRDKSCQQLWAKRRGYNSSSVIPNKCPDEVGWRAGSTACFCHSALQPVLGKVSWRSSGGGGPVACSGVRGTSTPAPSAGKDLLRGSWSSAGMRLPSRCSPAPLSLWVGCPHLPLILGSSMRLYLIII